MKYHSYRKVDEIAFFVSGKFHSKALKLSPELSRELSWKVHVDKERNSRISLVLLLHNTVLLFTFVYLHSPLFASIHPCLLPFTFVYLHLPLHTSVHLQSPPFTPIYLRSPLVISVYLRSPSFISVYLCSPLFTSVHLCLSLSISVLFTFVYLRLFLFTSVHLHSHPFTSIQLSITTKYIKEHECWDVFHYGHRTVGILRKNGTTFSH